MQKNTGAAHRKVGNRPVKTGRGPYSDARRPCRMYFAAFQSKSLQKPYNPPLAVKK